jgi:Domain of unknown function (DUF5655)
VNAPLWTCPKCGAKLVQRNMSHACGAYTVEGFLTGKSQHGQRLFKKFVELLESCGPVTPAPAKTRVAFMVRTRFASVNAVSQRELRIHFVLPERVESERIYKVEQFGPWYVHHVRISDLTQLDDELRGWLCQAYQLMGAR